MKLRQNEEKEIDLRTIVDGELNNQINSMLPMDGSKKMTGVLETVGCYGDQIKIGGNAIFYEANAKDTTITINGYTDAMGKLRFSSDGMCSAYVFGNKADGRYFWAQSDPGAKDKEVVWVRNGYSMTDKTGVKKSGDTMTGALTVAPVGYGSSRFEKYGTNTRIVNVHEDLTNYESLHVMKTISDNNLHSALILEANKKSYNIYGGHNPPVIYGSYVGNGDESRIIPLTFPASAGYTSTSGDGYLYPMEIATGGFRVSRSLNNINGSIYMYAAFK